MEDFKRRAEFNNATIQLQAVEKLLTDVRKKIPTGTSLSSSATEYPELVTAWQYVSSQHHVVARAVCLQWVELVRDGQAEFTYVLNGLLNQVPTASNLHGIVEAVCQLLVLKILVTEKAGETYKCPYTIRSPPHPFVTIVTNKPAESWPLILEQVSALLSHSQLSIRSKALVMLDPFFKFILLDPKSNDLYMTLRSALKVTLVAMVTETQQDDQKNSLFAYLLDIFAKLQVRGFQNVAELSQFCLQLLRVYGQHQGRLDIVYGQTLCNQALSVCLLSLHQNQSFTSLAQTVLAIGKKEPKVLVTPTTLGILGQLLLECYHGDSLVLLNIVRTILKAPDVTSLTPVTMSFVAMATLNVLAAPSNNLDPSMKTMVAMATDVINSLETQMTVTIVKTDNDDSAMSRDQLTPEVYQQQTCVRLANRLASDPARLQRWLHNLDGHLTRLKTVSWSMTNMLVALLLTTQDTTLAKLIIDGLTNIAKQDPTKGTSLLPLFLYTLGKKSCPRLRLHVMEALPKLATHKYTVPAVLKTILSLGQSPKLKPLSIRLLTQLWSLQDRCFPHLLKVITEKGQGQVTMTTITDEVTLAKAFAIKEVCRLRPEQHGGEMLAPLSEILNTCVDERGGPAAALAMEALYYICEAEVIDIRSAWRVLEKNLISETRVPVVEKICNLLSLVPSLQVKSEEYEEFLSESVRRLWLYTQTDCVAVVTAAYRALSRYNVEHFKISHFQFKIVEEYVTQAQSILAQEGNEGQTVDTIMPWVPGLCYIRQMRSVQVEALGGFEEFLCCMVGKEVENLPRGIYHTSLRQHGVSANQGKAVGTIPKFIQTSYEKTKQPGLRPGLAAGLLFCYDPPVEVGRDGRPRKHYLMSHGKNYQQMFNTLLHDIPVQPSEWHRMLLMPQAWVAFMERLFSSMLEARCAEVDLQLKRDFITETEADDMKSVAWLWVRDTVMDIIKRATKGNPSIQGNAILALAGLTLASQKLVTGLDKEERRRADEVTEHTSHSHWLMMVIDSCMSLVDNEYSPRSKLLGLCQQRAVDDRLPASVLAQATAILALCQLVPVIISHSTDLAYRLLTMLSDRLPGQPRSEDCPQVLHMFHGLGLGMLLANLVKENFPDLTGSKGTLAVMSALDKLEGCSLSSVEHRSGAVLGLGIALAALCRDGKVESRVHVSSVHGQLMELLQATAATDIVFQPLCYALATVIGTGFVSNALDIDKANNSLDLFASLHGDNKENQGVSLSLGMLCHSLSLGGHPTIDARKLQLHSQWMETITKGSNSAMERMAAVAGVMALVGSENCVQSIETDFSATSGDIKIDKVITEACQVISTSDHVGIQGSTSWLLGNLYMSLCSSNTSSSTVPVTYQYLQESSVLRYVVDFLTQAGKQGPEQVASQYVEICLSALLKEVTGSLPPLNWTGVLSPLMKLPFGDSVKLLCTRLTLRLCTSSTTAAMFLSSWIVPPLFNTLPESCQAAIFEAGESIVKSISPTVLQAYLDKSCTDVLLGDSQGWSLCRASVLKGVNSALKVPDPPEAVVALLYKFVRGVFEYLKAEQDPILLTGLSQCVSQLPEATFDELTGGDCTDADTIMRGTFIRGYLVGHGQQPIALFNSCIDAAFNNQCDKSAVVYMLMHAFTQMTVVENKTTRIMSRAQWLLEILGHVRNIITGHIQLADSQPDLHTVMTFALDIIAAAICAWTSPVSAAMFGLTSDLFSTEGRSHDQYSYQLELCPLDQLRGFIQQLDVDPWNQVVPKVLDWLMVMGQVPESTLNQTEKIKIKSCLASLRHSSDFAKGAMWTKAVMC